MRQRDDAASGSGAHLTEGELHTFLDGQVTVFGAGRADEIRAHLDSCERCRDRLAVESSVRDRATVLLELEGGVDPAALPSFEELRGRALGTGVVPERRSHSERRVRWGWAATVALSLGVGYGVGAWGPTNGRSPEALDAVATQPSTEEVPPEAAAAPSATEGAPAVTTEASPVGAEPSAPSLGGPGGDPRARLPTVAGAAPPPPAPVGLAAREQIVPGRSDTDSSSRARVPVPTVGEVVPPAARVAEIGEAEPSMEPSLEAAKVLASADSADGRGDSLSLNPGAAIDRLDAVESSARPPGLRDLAERVVVGSDSRLSSGATPPPLTLRSDAPAPLGLPPSPSPARERDETVADVSLVLEGSTIESLRWMEVWPGQPGLVSVQRLDGGLRVELRIAGPAVGDVEPVAPPPAERDDPVEGWSRAVGPMGAGWAVLDGPLPFEELAALLATIR